MHEARTSTHICPDLVNPKHYGHHQSHAKAGVRIWSFASEKGRAAFLRAVDGGAFRRAKKENL